MSGKTVRVTFENGRWAVHELGAKRAKQTFATKSEAVAEAKALARGTQPSQVVIHDRDGHMQHGYVYGLPKIQQLPYRSIIGTSQIERAVMRVSDMMGD